MFGEETVKPKLIAFDLDGTLFDDRKQISEENQKALQAASTVKMISCAMIRILCFPPVGCKIWPAGHIVN